MPHASSPLEFQSEVGRPAQPLLDDGGVNAVAFSPDGATLACARDSVKGHAVNPVISLWQVPTGKKGATLPLADNNRLMVSALAYHPDGKALAAGGSTYDATFKEQIIELRL